MTATGPVADRQQPLLELAILTGLSGAGRSTAAKCLEDLGWFVVDNLPPSLLAPMVELSARAGSVDRLAAVVDVRGGEFFADLASALDELRRRGVPTRVLFLEAADDALVRRFESVRRPHPLQHGDRITEGIERERVTLRELRGMADLVIDTTDLNVHQLRDQIGAAFAGRRERGLLVSVLSFGYKYGLPVDADMVVDMRFLPNPHWVEELRAHSGVEPIVRDYVLAHDEAEEFLERFTELLRLLAEGYQREGKRYLTVAVGCTGGKHRSVVMAAEIARRLGIGGLSASVQHRDLGRE